MPHLRESEFHHSVVLILEHDDSGAWGVVINKTIDLALSDVFDQLDIEPTHSVMGAEKVLRGGPVDEQHGIVLHPPGPTFESTREFKFGVSLSSSRDVLEALASGEEPAEHLVLLGHAGWGAGQLEEEIANNAWLTCEANTDILFETPIAERRDRVAKLMGINLDTIVGQTGSSGLAH
ncbi:MAG: YqgE/AlgH family protein [Gammaproteobacteria bacterium]|nr:YqgE/AlgH family protein [Gammaproteobacteria bacterium]